MRSFNHNQESVPIDVVKAEGFGAPGRHYLHQRDEILVVIDDLDRVAAALSREGIEPTGGTRVDDAGVVVFRVPPGDVPQEREGGRVAGVVARIRKSAGGTGPIPRVGPNHVMGIQDHGIWGTYGPPRPAPAPAPLPPKGPGLPGDGIRIAVVDTGVAYDHPYLDGRVESRGEIDDDLPDRNDDGVLDFGAGHGTFIAGVILQRAPGATIVARRWPDADGLVRDVEVAQALYTLLDERIDILNLSFGGHVHDDILGPIATSAMIGRLREVNPDLVVVAAAGNESVSTPMFPAADPQVVAVGALEGQVRAGFSNYGPWVDAWAGGTDVASTFLHWDGPVAAHDGEVDHCEKVRFDGFATWSGTSFAAPYVAGTVARTMQPGGGRPSLAGLVVASLFPQTPEDLLASQPTDHGVIIR